MAPRREPRVPVQGLTHPTQHREEKGTRKGGLPNRAWAPVTRCGCPVVCKVGPTRHTPTTGQPRPFWFFLRGYGRDWNLAVPPKIRVHMGASVPGVRLGFALRLSLWDRVAA